jgi:hypothetical protein
MSEHAGSRIRFVGEATADTKVRVLLEAASEGQVDEAALMEAEETRRKG